MMKKLKARLIDIAGYIEILLALIVAVTVVAGIPDLFVYIKLIFNSSHAISYSFLNEFLRHALLLVVGLELLIMISTHSHESILTLVLFVIARKMLVYADSMVDIFIGSMSIALIFFVLKRAVQDDDVMVALDNTYSAALPIKKINIEYNQDIPEDVSHTLGGLVYALASEDNLPIDEKTVVKYGDLTFEIVQATEGVIERVRIERS